MSAMVHESVNVEPGRIENIVRLGRWMHDANGGQGAQATGVYAARIKDPAFMHFMERFVEGVNRLCEAEQGESRRTSSNWYKPEPMVQQVYTKTLEAAQDGKHPHLLNNFSCQLGAMAVAAGLTPRPIGAP